jgi:glycosyltransferase involved in cell wall biosynthesis
MKLAYPPCVGYCAVMLSVVIEALNVEAALAGTLASLVEGAVEGVVREVLVLDGGSSDSTGEIAEQLGCTVLSGVGLAEVIAGAKGNWLLFIEPGVRLSEGWAAGTEAYIAAQAAMPARFTPLRVGRRPLFSWSFARPRALSQGFLISKKRAVARAKSADSAEALARGMAVKTLPIGIWPAAS